MNRPVEVGAIAPLYRDVKRLLTRSIAAGEWPPGAALPSETRLAERFNVSIGTLRKAIDELVAERMVVRQQGRGTFVATHGLSRLLFHFFHIVPRGGEKQYPNTRTLGFRRNRAGPDEARKLGLGPGESVLRIRNLLALQEQPVIVDDLVLPQRLFPDLTQKIFTARDNTIYHLYQTRYGINVLRTSERLRATLASAETARLLGVKQGAPLLEINRTALSYHDVPVELRRSLVNTEKHEYFSDLGKQGEPAAR
ncbi:MAG: GntR family transcriptional regulator [Betaproteobacteria bacterium]|nr:GntR family transcriptional regulator [Betaproteobacteria bacterium]